MNVVSRTQLLLRKIKGFPKQDESLGVAISNLLSIEDDISHGLERRYFEIIDQVKSLESKTYVLNAKSREMCERAISSLVRNLEKYTVSNALKTVAGSIAEVDLQALQFLSNQLDEAEPEFEISESALEKLKTDILQLMDDIRASEIDSELVRFFIYHLSRIHHAIENYQYFGPKGVKVTVANFMGSIGLEYDNIKKDEKIISKVFRAMGNINAVFSISERLVALCEKGGSLLPP